MALRKWVVRGLVFTVIAGIAVTALAIQHWTNPAIVRQQVQAHLEKYLPRAVVRLESARFALFGGITFHDLRLAREDDPEQADFAIFPSGTIYHEKDQLLDGKLVVRKIEFDRPRLHAIRRLDGSWNLENILAAPDLYVAVPTIVLKQATLVLEDKQAGLPPLEIKNIDLMIVNDPHQPPQISTLSFQGTGQTDCAGKLRVSGSWGRKSGELTLSLEAPSFPIDGALVERLHAYCPEVARHARQLSGLGELRADFSYQPTANRKWTYKLHGQLKQGKLVHAELPFPLDDLEAKVHYADGLVTVESLTAHSHGASLKLRDTTFVPSADPDFDGVLEVEHLFLTDELFARLPAKFQEIQKDFHPKGAISFTIEFRKEGQDWRQHCTVRPENAAALYRKFPYPMERITGQIEHWSDAFQQDKPDRLVLKLVGHAGTERVHLDGEVTGKGPAAGMDLKIWGKDLPIDEKLRGALEPEFQKIVDDFRPSGRVDVEAYIHHEPGGVKPQNRFVITFHDASLGYELFPYPVKNVTGILDIQPDHWEFRDFHGSHKGGEFDGRGGSDPVTKRVAISVRGANVLLDEEMEAALVRQPGLQNTWRKLGPSGRMSFQADVEQSPGQKEPDIVVDVRPLGCAIRPQFFPYTLDDMRGLILYRRGETVLRKLSARHGQTVLSVEEGKVYLKANGDVSVDLVDLLGFPIIPDADLFRAFPKTLGEICASLKLKEPLSFKTNMTISVPADQSPPYIYWDGGLRLKDASLFAGVQLEHVSGTIGCRGQYQGKFGNVRGDLLLDQAVVFNQPFQDIQCQLIVREQQPNVLVFDNVKARIYSGDVGGVMRIEFAPSLRYEMDWRASQVRLDQFARRNQLPPEAHLSGLAAARLYLRGQGTDLNGLEGAGSVDVPQGKMGQDLPLLIDLLKVLSLRLPDRTAFEEARIRFGIRGSRVEVNELNLYGNSISLTGEGTMNLDGSDLKLDFYAFWGRIMQISPPLINKIWPAISKQVLKIKMRGRFGKVECTKEPVPLLVEPVSKLLKQLSGKGKESRE
jgi:hypothetical protein